MTSWVDSELEGSKFRDGRLGTRFLKIARSLAERIGDSVPVACQDWASIKAAYRFFSNQNLNEEEILSGHFSATKTRYDETEGPILVLHDTTEIPYNRGDSEGIGAHRIYSNRRGFYSRGKEVAKCGIYMHPSLVITPEGLPLGLASNIFWSRREFKDSQTLRRKKNFTRIPVEEKESYRWIKGVKNSNELLKHPERLVHIGDREADIYEFFQESLSHESHFLVRSKTNSVTDDRIKKLYEIVSSEKSQGDYEIKYRDKNGDELSAQLEIKFKRVKIRPSEGRKRKLFPDTEVTIIFAKQKGKLSGNRDRIDWKIITDLNVNTLEDAIEMLQWYALRWRIESFFKILKSGCKIESLKLRTIGGLSKAISIYCVIAWRIFWMTMINRESESLSAKVALTSTEIKALDQLKPSKPNTRPVLSDYVIKIAKLGGYIGRNSDPPPGNKVIWKGMERLADILIGIEVGMKLVGN